MYIVSRSSKESGTRLNALPVLSLGLHMDQSRDQIRHHLHGSGFLPWNPPMPVPHLQSLWGSRGLPVHTWFELSVQQRLPFLTFCSQRHYFPLTVSRQNPLQARASWFAPLRWQTP